MISARARVWGAIREISIEAFVQHFSRLVLLLVALLETRSRNVSATMPLLCRNRNVRIDLIKIFKGRVFFCTDPLFFNFYSIY